MGYTDDKATELPIHGSPPRGGSKTARALRTAALFSAVAFLALHFWPTSNDSTHLDPEEPAIMAYWDGVSSRYRTESAAGVSSATRVQYQHDGEVGAAGHGDKGKHGCRWMSPKRAEEIYLTVPNNESAAIASTRYTSHAHPAGSGWDMVSALVVKNDWERELGLRVSGPEEYIFDAGSVQSQKRIKGGMDKLGVWIDTYYPVMNTPVSSSVTLFSDPPFNAKLREAQLAGDPDSKLADEVRVFHGLSVSGDVTAKYIYAGYGRKADFDLLQSKGIDFTGKIVIVKYGHVFRGLKVKAAQEAGAIGCLIYSDPGDDGKMTEENGFKQYPEGPARVLSMYPGDPTTPGVPAYPNATRIEGGNFPSIPSLPMSYEDAIPILNALKGKGLSVADLDPSFGGGLGFHGVEYFTGPSEVDIRVNNEVNTRVMPIWNTMAVIPGHITDEVVVMGNHRDAWVLGGSDPNAGTASQYEMVRGLGKLIRKGWKPLRTIVLASWDGEEYGLIGSTEWAEDFGSWLQDNAATYLNLDSSTSGSNFHGSASPSLARLLRGAAEDVAKGADASRSVWDARADGGDWDEYHGTVSAKTVDSGATGISPLGSGSDYTAFLMRYGIASTDFSFGGGPNDAVYHYHSIYDSHTWLAKYGDPGFHKHVEGAQIIGLIALRIADSLILPLNTTQYAHDLGGYLAKIEDLKNGDDKYASLDLARLGAAIEQLSASSAELDDTRADLLHQLHKVVSKTSYLDRVKHAFAHALGGCRPQRAAMPTWPAPEGTHAHAHAHGRARGDDDSAAGTTHTAAHATLSGNRKDIRKLLKKIRAVNLKLKGFEAGFISEEGITDREWYKHKGTSPGKWLGYGATTFPALTEALTIEHDVELAQRETDELAEMISAMATRLVA